MSKPNVIKIDDAEYVRADEVKEFSGEIKIVILQRGWIMVGYFNKESSDCVIKKSSTIRSWGTTNGLGEIAKNGPTSKTKLDKNFGNVQFDYLTVIATINCDGEKWKSVL